MRVVAAGSIPPNPPYAPPSPTIRQRSPVIFPSRVKPISMYWTCPRPWVMATMFSERLSTHFTGRPNRMAEAATTRYSAPAPALAPNAPPTSGTTTRTCAGSSPRASAISPHTRCGICVAGWMVTRWPCPSSPGTTAIAAPSIGTTASRWFSMRARTTTSASSSTPAPSPSRRPTARLEPMASICTGAPGASAASMSVTDGSGS